MRGQWLAIFVLMLAHPLVAQRVNLHRVDMTTRAAQDFFPPVSSRPLQRKAIRRLMATDADVRQAIANTGPYDDPLVFTAAPLRLGSPSVVAVKADGDQLHACCWIVDLARSPRILGNIGGGNTWGDWVQKPVHHGLHDFAEAHHMSADAFVLSYFRFDGRQYKVISHDEVHRCDPKSQEDIYCMGDGFRLKAGPKASYTPYRHR